MAKKKTPQELAASLRNECDSTVGTVRYSTALNAAKALDALSEAASNVIASFEDLGKTRDAEGVLVARAKCEAAMLRLKAALDA